MKNPTTISHIVYLDSAPSSEIRNAYLRAAGMVASMLSDEYEDDFKHEITVLPSVTVEDMDEGFSDHKVYKITLVADMGYQGIAQSLIHFGERLSMTQARVNKDYLIPDLRKISDHRYLYTGA